MESVVLCIISKTPVCSGTKLIYKMTFDEKGQIMAKDQKNKLLRTLQIMETTDEKSPVNSAQINKRLVEYGFEPSNRKAIYNDIEAMIECGYPVKQMSDPRKGWYFDSHAFEDWEIKLMMDAVQQARCVSVNEAREIKEKLLRLTSKRGRSRFAHLINIEPGNVIVDYKLGGYLETILEALYTKKRIEFQYTEIDKNLQKVLRREGKVYNLNIYAIYWSDDNYYLIGAHDHHDGLTHYRLDRVVNLTMIDEPVIEATEKIGLNPELQIRKYVDESVNHFSGETIRIEVEYEPEQVANAILYDFVGDNITVTEQPDGKCMRY